MQVDPNRDRIAMRISHLEDQLKTIDEAIVYVEKKNEGRYDDSELLHLRRKRSNVVDEIDSMKRKQELNKDN